MNICTANPEKRKMVRKLRKRRKHLFSVQAHLSFFLFQPLSKTSFTSGLFSNNRKIQECLAKGLTTSRRSDRTQLISEEEEVPDPFHRGVGEPQGYQHGGGGVGGGQVGYGTNGTVSLSLGRWIVYIWSSKTFRINTI